MSSGQNDQTPPSGGKVGLSSSALDFGDVLIGKTNALAVTVTNAGPALVTISSVSPSVAQFTISGISLPLSIAAGKSAKCNITFTPAAEGRVTGTISIVSNASNGPVGMSLLGIGIGQGQLATPTSISFGNLVVGGSQTKSATFSNPGSAGITISGATVSGASFQMSNLGLPLTLNPGTSTNANITFTPQSVGAQNGSISLTTTATVGSKQVNDSVTIPLSGQGVSPIQLGAIPTSTSFTNVTVETTASQPLTLTNSGISKLNILQATVTGTGFSLTGLTLPLALAAGKSVTFSVVFAPHSEGSVSGNITFTSDGTNPTLSVPVSGTAVAAGKAPQSRSVFFGIHQAHFEGCDKAQWAFPLFDVPAGAYRDYGACNTLWAQMNPAKDTFDFSGLDTLYSALKAHSVDDVFIVLGNTPNWISSNPTDPVCDLANLYGLPAGMCDPPEDLKTDGTGTDLAWRSFVTALLKHVTASGYADTHAHIQIYEIWDEYQRSDTLNNFVCSLPRSQSTTPTCTYRGTYAQMLRMTQDLRCIVKGISSDPITALNTTCGQDSTMPARGLDPTALVTEGDAGGEPLDKGNQVMQNYLYCNNSPIAGSRCNYGSAGSASTDIISGHTYFVNGQVPEHLMNYIAAQKAMLSPADAAKPYITGEGSWGHNVDSNGSPGVSDPQLQAAFVVRWYLMLLMSNVSRGYWYAWDESQSSYGSGGLWSPTRVAFPPLKCTTPNPTIAGYNCTGEAAYFQAVNWLSGATVTNFTCSGACSSPDPGMFTLTLTRSGGYQAQILWDSSTVTTCTNVQCGSTPLPVLSFTAVQWRDVAGVTHSGTPSNIGASPVIVENMAPPAQ
ncbi:MAG: choice-of-anchor D domain-containing protein [Terriglobales bacterium]